MADTPQLLPLLLRWQEYQRQGRSPPPEELCPDNPELARWLCALLGGDATMAREGGPAYGLPSVAVSSPGDSVISTLTDRQTSPELPVVLPLPQVPGYEVLGELGRGGMGMVYKARQLRPQRVVALKMIRRGKTAPADLQRFRNEADVIAQIQHPNIVQVYEVGEQDGQPFFSLEFCGGGSLERRAREGPVASPEAARLVEVLARAVHAVHQHGIVHRDLKPANVLLTEDGVPKITDFGLSRLAEVAEPPSGVEDPAPAPAPRGKRLTQSGALLGTPSYMAPEQADGRTDAIGPLTDVYALGTILYELLTGRPPFKTPHVYSTLLQVLQQEPAPPRRLQPGIPRDLETVCLKCLRKDPTQRYQSAGELAAELQLLREGKPIRARQVGPAERAWRWARRNPALAGLLALGALVLLVVPPVVVWYETRLAYDRDLARQQENTVAALRRAEQAARDAAATQQYFARLNRVRQRRAEPAPGWTWHNLADLADLARSGASVRDPVELRQELAASLGSVDLRRQAVLADGMEANRVAFSPDGKYLAVTQLKDWLSCPILLLDPATGARAQLLTFPSSVVWNPDGRLVQDGPWSLRFSPDSRFLFVGTRSGRLHRWQLDAGQSAPRVSWDGHAGHVWGLEISPDGQSLYSAGKDGLVKRWPVAGDVKEQARCQLRQWHEALCYLPGSPPRLLAGDGGKLEGLDAVTLQRLPPLPLPGGPSHPVLHPATRTLAGDVDGSVVVWDTERWLRTRTLTDPELGSCHAGGIAALAVHPGGAVLATLGNDDHLKLWSLPAGRQLACLPVGRSFGGLAFSPDGRRLAVTGAQQTLLLELRPPAEQTFLAQQGRSIQAIGLGNGGRTLACVSTVARPPSAVDVVISTQDLGEGPLKVLHGGEVVRSATTPALACHPDSPLLACSPVGRNLLTFAGDGSGPRVHPLLQPRHRLQFSCDPSGQTLWVAADDQLLSYQLPGAARLSCWTNSLGVTLRGLAELRCVQAGRRWVLVGGLDGSVYLFPHEDAARPAQAWDCGGGAVVSIGLAPDESLVAAGLQLGRVRVLRVPGGTVFADLEAHQDRVDAVAFSADGTCLATGGRDRRLKLWRRTESGFEPLVALDHQGGGPVRQLAFSPDGSRLLVLLKGEHAVRVWRLDLLRQHFRELRVDW
jgi:WD40 repeat protein